MQVRRPETSRVAVLLALYALASEREILADAKT